MAQPFQVQQALEASPRRGAVFTRRRFHWEVRTAALLCAAAGLTGGVLTQACVRASAGHCSWEHSGERREPTARAVSLERCGKGCDTASPSVPAAFVLFVCSHHLLVRNCWIQECKGLVCLLQSCVPRVKNSSRHLVGAQWMFTD